MDTAENSGQPRILQGLLLEKTLFYCLVYGFSLWVILGILIVAGEVSRHDDLSRLWVVLRRVFFSDSKDRFLSGIIAGVAAFCQTILLLGAGSRGQSRLDDMSWKRIIPTGFAGALAGLAGVALLLFAVSGLTRLFDDSLGRLYDWTEVGVAPCALMVAVTLLPLFIGQWLFLTPRRRRAKEGTPR